MNKYHRMDENARVLVLVVALTVGLFWAFVSATSLPTVQVGRDGKCVKVLAVENGQEVARGCDSVDLKNGRYQVQHVFGTDAENKAFAAEIAANIHHSSTP